MSWPKGKPHAEETKRKISAWGQENKPFLGHHHSDEAKQTLSVAMSKTLQGNKRRLGIPHTEETKRKISQTLRSKWRKDKDFIKANMQWREQLSPEDWQRITRKSTDAMKAFWQSLTPDERLAVNANGRKAASLVRPTSIELAIEELLKSLGITFESQKPIGKFIVDIYIPTKKMVIECDGDYWHALPSAIKRDKAKAKLLSSLGYNLLRIPERIIKNDEQSCIAMIESAMNLTEA